jgi:hypothetical protein
MWRTSTSALIQGGLSALGDGEVLPKKFELLVSVRGAGNLSPAARTLSVLDALNATPDVEIVGNIKPSGAAAFYQTPLVSTSRFRPRHGFGSCFPESESIRDKSSRESRARI